MPPLSELYQRYGHELRELGRKLQPQYHAVVSRGYRATFGDVEGEALYLLIRESRPQTVFEISPDCGWSTNYILAALTANAQGRLHSFELAQRLRGQPTEAAIRGNLHPDWDQDRLTLHIGDARTTTEQVPGPIDFVLLDSCHERFFAEWYVRKIFPRVQGLAFVQDIAFHDEREPSGEADCVWEWATEARPAATMIGAWEYELASSKLRDGIPERRAMRSNSIYLELPVRSPGTPLALAAGPAEWIARAEAAVAAGDTTEAERWLTRAVSALLDERRRGNRQRLLLRAGQVYARLAQPGEAARCRDHAVGVVMLGDYHQRQKGLRELARTFRKQGQWRLSLTCRLLSWLGPRPQRATSPTVVSTGPLPTGSTAPTTSRAA